MPRRLRRDYPGALHHVMSRGIAKRTIFETRRDVRYFLSRLAREVRRGDLEVLVYSVLTTHFHALIRSPRGHLSAAMQRVLDAYARWFNRGRRRDGPLFVGRFVNRLVESESYAYAVVRYIDDNAVRFESWDSIAADGSNLPESAEQRKAAEHSTGPHDAQAARL